MEKLYYQEPSEELFNEMKTLAIQIWERIHDVRYWPNEKAEHIRRMWNVRDNFMTILAMFDEGNRQDLLDQASEELQEAVRLRIESVQ